MKLMHRLISAGFATAALASAAVPTLALSSWQDLELGWVVPAMAMDAMPAGQPDARADATPRDIRVARRDAVDEARRDDAAATGSPRR